MSGKPNQKFKTVFADVLNLVRLLAMYFGLYILSYLALSSTALKDTSAPVGLIVAILSLIAGLILLLSGKKESPQ